MIQIFKNAKFALAVKYCVNHRDRISRNTNKSYTKSVLIFDGLLFLLGVFEEKARLLQWLVFFRQFNAIGPLFLFICSTSWPRG